MCILCWVIGTPVVFLSFVYFIESSTGGLFWWRLGLVATTLVFCLSFPPYYEIHDTDKNAAQHWASCVLLYILLPGYGLWLGGLMFVIAVVTFMIITSALP
jgi:hypothetical protein